MKIRGASGTYAQLFSDLISREEEKKTRRSLRSNHILSETFEETRAAWRVILTRCVANTLLSASAFPFRVTSMRGNVSCVSASRRRLMSETRDATNSFGMPPKRYEYVVVRCTSHESSFIGSDRRASFDRGMITDSCCSPYGVARRERCPKSCGNFISRRSINPPRPDRHRPCARA